MLRHYRGSLVVVVLMFVGLVPFSSSQAAAGTHKVLVDRADGATQTMLAQGGARLLVDYDSFALWEVPDSGIQTLAGRAGVQQRDDFDDISVRTGKITPPSGVPTVPANLRQSKASGYQLWMVQFVGPVKPDWLDNLTKLGIAIVIYMPNNAYVVWVDGAGLTRLEALVGKDPTVQWTGAYEPAYRLEPSLQRLSGSQLTPVSIQFYRTANTAASLASVQALGGAVLKSPEEILGFTNITLEIPASALVNIANRADVFNVEPFLAPQRRDEVQDQIVAGNIATSGTNVVPSGPGYLTWLASQGFPTDPAQYPLVDIVDDGIDNGSTNPLHPDFHQLGVGTNASRLIFNQNCTADAAADGKAGHGNLNAGIVGAYDNLTGSPSVDANGYRLGLGVSPYTRLAGTKIFANSGAYDVSACGNTDSGIVANAYTHGATFTSNSWGADAAGAYDSDAQAYDALTRDASATIAGNQQMLHVFAAGNAGSGMQTVGSPGTAKNVLTVGATENVRENGFVDGCGYSGAASADNIATFSSRGPTTDGRVKPDVMAPGTHIQGPASQDPGYDGSGVCDKYHPAAGQTLYAMSSGTSHSTPATAGAVSLLYNYYGRVLKPGQTPSPAMLKALLLNTPRYLNGAGAGGNLPSNNQGWGDVDLGTLFDGTMARYLVDQSTPLTATGQTYVRSGTVASNAKPVRVTLAWTDAPGSTTGAAYVNNLDLVVTVGGIAYKGNVFSGANSAAGGAADAKDNVENVFLPAGVSGPITVRVTATTLAGVGVPGAAGTVNQDFALVVSNSTMSGVATANLGVGDATFSDASTGNNNGAIDPGETVTVSVPLLDGGDATATAVSGTLTTSTGTVTILSGTASYADIAANTSGAPATPFRILVSAAHPCGTPLDFSFTATYNGGLTASRSFSLPTGLAGLGASVNHASTDVPKAIPDNTPAGVISNLTITGVTGAVGKLIVHLSATHTYDSDLTFTLIAPDTTPVVLIAGRGGSGDNFTNTVLDDGAPTAIAAGTAPFTGSYRPEQPLATLDGKAIDGTWQLNVADKAAQDTGTLTGWSLDISPAISNCDPVTTTISGLSATSGPISGSPLTIAGKGFQSTATVTVGGTPVTPTGITGTQITLVTPPHAAGTVTIVVTTTLGAPTAQFTYAIPNALPGQRPPGGTTGAPNPLPGARATGTTGGGAPNPLPSARP